MDFEILNERIGGCGRYQYVVFFLLSMTTFKYAGDVQALTFALYVPKFECVIPNNDSMGNQSLSSYTSKDQCQYRIPLNSSWMPCSKWIYEKTDAIDSFIIEFDMVCDRAYLRDLMFSVFFFGRLSSYPLIMFTDMVGRRIILIIFLFLSVICTIWQLLIHSRWQQFMLAFFSGFSNNVCTCLAFTTLIELTPTIKMDIAGSNFWIFYSICYMASALFAFLGRTWRAISLMCLVFTIVYFLYFWFVPETPRWLMLNEKREKAYKTMSFIAKINRKSLSRKYFDEWKPIRQKTGKFWNLFKYKTMVYRLLILNFAAWTFAFAYIGSSTDLTFASNNIFITMFFMGLTELPACPLGGYLINKFGRKRSLYSLCGLGIICLLPLPFLEPDLSISIWQPWFKVIIAMGAKLGLVSAWVIFDIITSEIIPTTDRNSAMSLVYIAVGLGSIVAPTIHNAASIWYHALPCLIYAAMLVITIVLVALFIPETHTLPVPQTIEQAVSLVIKKEQEWKANMILQAHKQGINTTNDDKVESKLSPK